MIAFKYWNGGKAPTPNNIGWQEVEIHVVPPHVFQTVEKSFALEVNSEQIDNDLLCRLQATPSLATEATLDLPIIIAVHSNMLV